jgi:large subunit ribosomal protein L25
VRRLRRNAGMLPGVLYGHTQAPVPFKIATRTLERALSKGGQNAIFLVAMEGEAQRIERAVVREIQYHKVRGDVVHVDLLRVDPEERLRVSVPLVTTGVPVGVRTGGGALQHPLSLVEMECVASELPARVEIDITELQLGQSVHVRDLLEQEGRIVTDPDTTVVSVLTPRVVTVAAPTAEGEAGAEGQAEGGEGAGESASE